MGPGLSKNLPQDVPAALARDHVRAQQASRDLHRVFEQQFLSRLRADKAEPFELARQRTVRRLRGGRKPAFIDAAAVARRMRRGRRDAAAAAARES